MTTPMSIHARRSPSVLKHMEQCPGFEGKEESSAASEEGTKLHRYMELQALGFPERDQAETDRLSLSFSQEQVQQLNKLISYVAPLINENYRNGGLLFIEHALNLAGLGIDGCDKGTPDLILVAGETAQLVDYKFGRVPVDDPADNIQFQVYALGIFEKFPSVEKITVHCLQPRIDEIGTAAYARNDAPKFLLRAKTIVARCNKRPLEFNPKTSLCEYCRNLAQCPAVATFALKVESGPATPEDLDFMRVKDDPEKLGALYAWSRLLEEKGKSMQKHITDLAAQGNEVNGYLLQNTSGRHTVIDPVGLAQDIRGVLGFTDEQLFSCCDISLPKVLDIVGKNAARGEKETAAQNARKELLDGGFFKTGTGYSYLKKIGK